MGRPAASPLVQPRRRCGMAELVRSNLAPLAQVQPCHR
jgi:hypothetical protein